MVGSISPHIYASLHKIDSPCVAIDYYLRGEIRSKIPLPKFIFKLITGGPQSQSKLRAQGVYIFSKEESTIGFDEFITISQKLGLLLREKIKKSKSGADSLKEEGDGSILSPYDTIADCLKAVEEAITEAGGIDILSVWLDIDAAQFYNSEQDRYEFENAKKASTAEELEDALFKTILDRKSVEVIQDPFRSEDRLSWHRLNV